MDPKKWVVAVVITVLVGGINILATGSLEGGILIPYLTMLGVAYMVVDSVSKD